MSTCVSDIEQRVIPSTASLTRHRGSMNFQTMEEQQSVKRRNIEPREDERGSLGNIKVHAIKEAVGAGHESQTLCQNQAQGPV